MPTATKISKERPAEKTYNNIGYADTLLYTGIGIFLVFALVAGTVILSPRRRQRKAPHD